LASLPVLRLWKRSMGCPAPWHMDLQRPSHREPQHPLRAPARTRARRGRPADEAPAAGERAHLRADRLGPRHRADLDLTRPLGRACRAPPSDAPIRSADSIILALRDRFDADAAHGFRAGYERRLGEDRFRIEVTDDEIDVARGSAQQSDATIDTRPRHARRRALGRPVARRDQTNRLTAKLGTGEGNSAPEPRPHTDPGVRHPCAIDARLSHWPARWAAMKRRPGVGSTPKRSA
jgi:hypothetical protein